LSNPYDIAAVNLNLDKYADSLNIKLVESKKHIFDPVRRKYILLTPEEFVRQLFVLFLLGMFPASHISIEKNIPFGKFRPDIVVYNFALEPFIIVELKEPGVKINLETLLQVGKYNAALQARYLFLSNGLDTYLIKINKEGRFSEFLTYIPDFIAELRNQTN